MYLGFPLDLEPVARIGVCLSRPRVVLARSVVVAVRLTLLRTGGKLQSVVKSTYGS